ncbi:DNA topoisomerase IV subunit A [Vagococcus fluvialis]|uniref:DNA topoisomerase 4 subunit A n=2 Tax=Vagococcus fluvialis TaxID=2738 RepID=A0A369AS99_9ENTE|nr:DNA topoisomerase IV subunit A [Vagococcus fluvialis]MBO0480464.1 DNA topoisomerase IV subunit A [Vagococcus fluvialis]MBO0484839.1 DNA topoisomerase IV subunit A [Vagococcus fluvialis]MDT2782311.1 DNA topoisomerase IV subunit A [Vagococcus fluvialis]NKC68265.1 DNA topoisomerase IV subunit A [Vagococcus fluvialis]RCX12240.1 DNA topoisomerase IV subunit A [Vagococcus fluvialis]
MSERQGVQQLTLEEIMGDRFGRYSKYIIQDRALPDIRDGLKPVQRRILFSMNKDGNTFEKAFRKSAKSVGNIMGNYHPHGDSSIYEAMVRMSQDWKLRNPLIEMHGNNGSMDGDPPAAMRYTEARLSELSGELLTDIEKETVNFVWNFDDTEKEPTVLPAKYPNLLVNGSTGISAGYATEIPTHNLAEIIDGTVYLIDHPNASLDKLMEFIPGPDFPTGGILQGKKELKKAYETGKGKVILRSKTAIEPLKAGREQIVITEIPYEVNKAVLVKKMDELRLNRRLEGISEVRDESDRTGLRIVVELKKEVDAEGILNYLFKNTDLQINYNFNMVAIHKLRPEQVGLKTVLDAYIDHRKDVIRKRSEFDLKKAKNRQHIVSGLIKALSILDQVIATIRGSKDKKDAKMNLVKEYDFTEEQAEAIVSLQLYRLTNTDITALEKESKELSELIAKLQLILNNEKELLNVMKTELREVKKQYKTPRLTKLEDEIAEITIETAVLIPQEDVMVSITKEGYAKRSSLRSYSASKEDTIEMKETDRLIFSSQLNTHDHLLIVTNKGNMIYRPVHELIDKRWKDVGEHFSLSITSLGMGENIVAVFPYSEISQTKQFVFVTKEGMIKRTQMKEFDVWRTYKSRPTLCIKLKTDTDEIIAADLIEENSHKDVLLVTNMAFGLYYDLDEVPVVGARAAGVKSINLKADDFVVDGLILDRGEDVTITIVTQRGSIKRMKVSELSKLGRAKRGLMVLRELKSNPHRVFSVVKNQDNKMIHIVAENNKVYQVNYKDLPINDRQSNGSFIIDEKQDGSVKEVFTEIIE